LLDPSLGLVLRSCSAMRVFLPAVCSSGLAANSSPKLDWLSVETAFTFLAKDLALKTFELVAQLRILNALIVN